MFLLVTKGASLFLDSPEVQVSILIFSYYNSSSSSSSYYISIIDFVKNISGLAHITKNEARLWTDGRYFLQATQQLSDQWKLMRIGEDPPVDVWMSDVNLPFCFTSFRSFASTFYTFINIYLFLMNE